MEFKSVEIKNFRNFEQVRVVLKNRNVFFGLNDVGKTNFLYAIRFLLDYFIRKDGFKLTDFHKSDDTKQIEITLELDISNVDDEDTKKIMGKAGKSLSSANMSSLFIQAKSSKDDGLYNVDLHWGGTPGTMQRVPMVGMKSDLDKVFDVNYIDAQTDLDGLFKRAVSMKNVMVRKDDDDTAFKTKLAELNTTIETLSSISNFESSLSTELSKYESDIKLKLSSKDIALDPYKTIYPFLKRDDEALHYVSGDGMRKITSYSLHRLIALKNKGKKITIFLVEEPENHLHKTTLLKLAQVLFKEDEFPYIFLTTHSPELLAEMDKINLVRIACANKTFSHFYTVPDDYQRVKKLLNTNLAKALFYDKVLLVEGPSESVLFDAVLTHKCQYKTKGMEILPVNGIAFKEYLNVLIPLHMDVFMKTDNDIRDGDASGLKRIKTCGTLIATLKKDEEKKAQFEAATVTIPEAPADLTKPNLFAGNSALIELCKTENVFLSKVDLEDDLAEALGDTLATRLGKANVDKAVKYLKSSKLYNMVELVGKLINDDFDTIFNHANFAVLGGFANETV